MNLIDKEAKTCIADDRNNAGLEKLARDIVQSATKEALKIAAGKKSNDVRTKDCSEFDQKDVNKSLCQDDVILECDEEGEIKRTNEGNEYSHFPFFLNQDMFYRDLYV